VSDSEKRKFSRVSADLALFDAGTGVYRSVPTKDVSMGGLYLVLGNSPPVGTRLRLALAEGSDRKARVRKLVEVEVEVKRQLEDGVGVEFVDPSDAFMTELTRVFFRE